MNASFASQPSHQNSQQIYERVRHLDQSLTQRLRYSIGPEQAGTLLQQVEAFYHQAWLEIPMMRESIDVKHLIAAGCRLSSDLNEKVLAQLIDQAQAKDEAIAQLSRALAEQLMARAQLGQLLKKSQTLKLYAVETSQTAGLGVGV